MKMISLLFILIFSLTSFAQKLELKDLGVGAEEVKADPKLEQDLKIRKEKLQMHQKLGLLTAGLAAASLLTGGMAEEDDGGEDGEGGGNANIHYFLGYATAAAYWTTAYYSMSAPEPKTSGSEANNVKVHKLLRWVHMPLMILTPIAGYMASQGQENGLSDHKKELGVATGISILLAGSVMYFEF